MHGRAREEFWPEESYATSNQYEDQRLRVAFERVTFGIGLVDQDGKFSEVKGEVSEMFGLEMQENDPDASKATCPVAEEEARAHIAQHFKDEEKIPRQNRFPKARAHTLSHSRLLERQRACGAIAEAADDGRRGFAIRGPRCCGRGTLSWAHCPGHIVLEDRNTFPG